MSLEVEGSGPKGEEMEKTTEGLDKEPSCLEQDDCGDEGTREEAGG